MDATLLTRLSKACWFFELSKTAGFILHKSLWAIITLFHFCIDFGYYRPVQHNIFCLPSSMRLLSLGSGSGHGAEVMESRVLLDK